MEKEFYDKLVLDVATKAADILESRNADRKIAQLDNHVQTYTVKEVAKITNRCKTTICNHIKCDPPLLLARKGGKNWIITHENLNIYIGTQNITL